MSPLVIENRPQPIPEVAEEVAIAYPLHVGAQWLVVPGSAGRYKVTGHEVLELPVGRLPAFRVELISPDLGPDDRYVRWFGQQGQLKEHFLRFIEIPGSGGDRLRYEFVEELIDYSLVE